MKAGPITRIEAAAVRDAAGVNASPGVVLLQGGRVLDAGAAEKLGPAAPDHTTTIDLRDRLVMPALVNAHTHLDLTHVPPPPSAVQEQLGAPDGFVGWVRHVIQHRPTAPDATAAAVRDGLTQSWAQGTGILGDIAGSIDAIAAWHDTAADALPHDTHDTTGAPAPAALAGVSYLELFGRGDDAVKQAIRHARQQLAELDFEVPVPGHDRGVVLGVSPHAPYSCDMKLYREAVKLSQQKLYRICTHLAETRAETHFIKDGSGPFADLLQELGKQAANTRHDTAADAASWIKPILSQARWAIVHGNHVAAQHHALLARHGVCVVYCPAASDYFGEPCDDNGNPRPHPYRDMLDAGVTVALGTDSVASHPADAAQPYSVWQQMRWLHARDGVDPGVLLTMATVYGLQALELPDDVATLQRGASSALIAADLSSYTATDHGNDPLAYALQRCEAVTPIRWDQPDPLSVC